MWPITGEQNAKQFLRILPRDNGAESMLERIIRQLGTVSLSRNLTIITGAMQRDIVLSQLSSELPNDNEINVIAEPERRNTFPAIALACAYLRLEKGCSLEEPVLVMPVDSYVSDDYFRLLATMGDELEKYPAADVILAGAKPIYPSHKYGYILPKAQKHPPSHSQAVQSFREKPDEQQAARLIEQGALWNCGVFAFKLRYVFDELCRRIAVTSYPAVLEQYGALEKDSIDRVLLENKARARVLPYGGSWMDVGTWNTLADVIGKNSYGNARQDSHCENTQVINTTDKPVIVMGAKDMVVVVSDEGILVTDKHQSSYVLDMLKEV